MLSQTAKTLEQALNQFNPRQQQLILGSMLGDSNISSQNLISGRLRIAHSSKQHAYNQAKHQILSEYTNKGPEISENQGYGEWSSIWSTRSLPVFRSLYELMYPHGVKTLFPAWIQALDLEGLMYWYLDDGTLSGGRVAVFSTHGFTETELWMAAGILREKWKLDFLVRPIHKKEKTYHVIILGTKDTKIFVDMIKDKVPESMKYKVDFRQRYCRQCGDVIPVGRQQSTCGEACKILRLKTMAATLRSLPENRARINQHSRDRYWADLEASRARARATSAKHCRDNPESVKASKKKHYDKQMNDPEEYKKLKAERDRYYQRVIEDPERKARRLANARAYRKARRVADPVFAETERQRVRDWRASKKTASSALSAPASTQFTI